MANPAPTSVLALPVEIVHDILDYFDKSTIFFLIRNVCRRWNMITDSYRRYQTLSKLYLYENEISSDIESHLETMVARNRRRI
ncbi:unnamed protein product [Rotaria sp. Silwood2]|nr:unnamed protein product [Rotaria sp. Silwood2]